MTLTKADIVEKIFQHIGGTRKEAQEFVELFFETIKERLERGEKVKVSGFGNFVIRDKNSRIGRNPKTGEQIQICARRVLTFKASDILRDAVNK